jgi:hypothetical protein
VQTRTRLHKERGCPESHTHEQRKQGDDRGPEWRRANRQDEIEESFARVP